MVWGGAEDGVDAFFFFEHDAEVFVGGDLVVGGFF